MEKKIINVDWLAQNAPYSHAVEANGFIFVSGTVPVDNEKGLAIRDDVAAATRLVLENIKRILESRGSSLNKVVKTTVFLTDMSAFQTMNEVYVTFFPSDRPARSCVGVKELPGNFPVEIEAVALK